jgi:hypothetical protein
VQELPPEGREIPSANIFFSGKFGQTTALYLIRELCRFLFCRDRAAFAARKRCLGLIYGRKDFSAPPLLSLPKRHSFLQRVFLSLVAATLYSLLDKSPLAGRKLHFQVGNPQHLF